MRNSHSLPSGIVDFLQTLSCSTVVNHPNLKSNVQVLTMSLSLRDSGITMHLDVHLVRNVFRESKSEYAYIYERLF